MRPKIRFSVSGGKKIFFSNSNDLRTEVDCPDGVCNRQFVLIPIRTNMRPPPPPLSGGNQMKQLEQYAFSPAACFARILIGSLSCIPPYQLLLWLDNRALCQIIPDSLFSGKWKSHDVHTCTHLACRVVKDKVVFVLAKWRETRCWLTARLSCYKIGSWTAPTEQW